MYGEVKGPTSFICMWISRVVSPVTIGWQIDLFTSNGLDVFFFLMIWPHMQGFNHYIYYMVKPYSVFKQDPLLFGLGEVQGRRNRDKHHFSVLQEPKQVRTDTQSRQRRSALLSLEMGPGSHADDLSGHLRVWC